MTDDHPRRWLNDDPIVLNAALVVAATTVAITLTSCLWHHARQSLDKQHPDDPPSFLSTTLASFRFSLARTVPATTQQSPAISSPVDGQSDCKSIRSKERRRRGKDPFRDLLKGGKKSKALLKAIEVADHDHSPPSADTLSNSSAPQNDTTSSTSRSQSPEPASDLLDMDRLGVESYDGSATSMTPNGNMSSSSAVTSATDISDHGSSDAVLLTDSIPTHSLPIDSMTATDAEVNVSSASTIATHTSAPSSPPYSTSCSDTRMPQARDSQAAYRSGSCAKLVRARTKLRLSRMDPNVISPLLPLTPPPLPDSVASSFNSIQSIVPCPSLSITSSTYSTDGVGPSTPTNSRGSTPPPRSLLTSTDPGRRDPIAQPLDETAASAQIQLASMRSALEASRVREEQLRIEAEQASKERDELRWGWNEDASIWRRREAELHSQIHHLMQQLQAYAAVASFRAQQATSPFSSPTSPHIHMSPRLHQHPFPLPPVIQTQNSASAPAHVQALLASAPVLTSHPPGFATSSGGSYSGTGFGMSPLLWSGLGLCVPNRDTRHCGRRTPDSSASGSSSEGRRRCAENAKSASDDSLGDWDGMENGSGDEDKWEEEEAEDVFRNNVLADAILKRPESIRELSSPRKRSGGRPAVQGEWMDALKDPALEKPGFCATAR
ncbi:hypothetical protein JVT61DRAFT_7080 [Boletus reticuloceps]|uniref:Uncharacterized protein n=1 Tax=Boletus reticuloceps TaxID=495285 RepID=A0A8I3A821_9AGAM|nr:hypothetical protein JVT61DRAFT_7080 [Boletus reticuloceps]